MTESLMISSANKATPRLSQAPLTRDEVVANIVRFSTEAVASTTPEEEKQRPLRKLIHALRNRKGRFDLIFAVCNEVPQRRELTQRIIAGLSDQHPVELQLDGKEESLLETLFAAPGAPEPLIIYGLELLLPSADNEKIRREQTFQELQIRREKFRQLGRPLVFWMPEYVYTLIGQHAVDFWSWQSGGFFFTGQWSTIAPLRDDYLPLLSRFSQRYPVRPLRPDFVGRESQIAALTSMLREGNHVVIHGMAGIGKTSLALFFAQSLKADYPDAQLLIPLRSSTEAPRSPGDGLRDIIYAFRPDEKLPDEPVLLTALYRNLLSHRRALIILDDAPNATAVHPFLPPPGSVLLVTSRHALNLPAVRSISLDYLAPAEARKLLLYLAPRLTLELADQIVALCGYLPLAIRMAGSFLAVAGEIDPIRYIEQLRHERTQFDRLAGERVNLKIQEWLIRQNCSRLDAETARVFQQLTVFPASFDAAAEEIVCLDPDNIHLKTLVRHSLVFYDEAANRYHLHDLIRSFVTSKVEPEAYQGAASRHAAHYVQSLSTANMLYLKGGEALKQGLGLFDREWENIQAGQVWAATRSEADQSASLLCSDYSEAGAHLLELRLHPQERVRWFEVALTAAQRLNKPAAIAGHLGNLGNAYMALSEPRRAIEFYEQALIANREIANRLGEGGTLGNLGNAYITLGEVNHAIEYYEQHLVIAREIGDRRGEGNSLGNLGYAFMMRRDYRQALAYYQQHHIIAHEIGDRQGESRALNNLGVVYNALGDPQHTVEILEQNLTLIHEFGDRHGESTTLLNLGDAYVALKQFHHAGKYYEQALFISREIGDRRMEGMALGSLGIVYSNLGRPDHAIEFYEQQLQVTKESGDRFGEAYVMGSLGYAYHAVGKFQNSIELYQRQLALARESNGLISEEPALGNLGAAYYALADFDRARAYFEEQLKIARGNDDQRASGQALFNLGLTLHKLGERAAAIKHVAAALEIYEQLDDQSNVDHARQQLSEWMGQSAPKDRGIHIGKVSGSIIITGDQNTVNPGTYNINIGEASTK